MHSHSHNPIPISGQTGFPLRIMNESSINPYSHTGLIGPPLQGQFHPQTHPHPPTDMMHSAVPAISSNGTEFNPSYFAPSNVFVPPPSDASNPLYPASSPRSVPSTAASPKSDSASPKTPSRRLVPSSSCHQCKTTKHRDLLLYCHGVQAPPKKRHCKKKYCDACLRRCYDIGVTEVSSEARATWICPSCEGRCACASCIRKIHDTEFQRRQREKGVTEGGDAAKSMSPSEDDDGAQSDDYDGDGDECGRDSSSKLKSNDSATDLASSTPTSILNHPSSTLRSATGSFSIDSTQSSASASTTSSPTLLARHVKRGSESSAGSHLSLRALQHLHALQQFSSNDLANVVMPPSQPLQSPHTPMSPDSDMDSHDGYGGRDSSDGSTSVIMRMRQATIGSPVPLGGPLELNTEGGVPSPIPVNSPTQSPRHANVTKESSRPPSPHSRSRSSSTTHPYQRAAAAGVSPVGRSRIPNGRMAPPLPSHTRRDSGGSLASGHSGTSEPSSPTPSSVQLNSVGIPVAQIISPPMPGHRPLQPSNRRRSTRPPDRPASAADNVVQAIPLIVTTPSGAASVNPAKPPPLPLAIPAQQGVLAQIETLLHQRQAGSPFESVPQSVSIAQNQGAITQSPTGSFSSNGSNQFPPLKHERKNSNFSSSSMSDDSATAIHLSMVGPYDLSTDEQIEAFVDRLEQSSDQSSILNSLQHPAQLNCVVRHIQARNSMKAQQQALLIAKGELLPVHANMSILPPTQLPPSTMTPPMMNMNVPPSTFLPTPPLPSSVLLQPQLQAQMNNLQQHQRQMQEMYDAHVRHSAQPLPLPPLQQTQLNPMHQQHQPQLNPMHMQQQPLSSFPPPPPNPPMNFDSSNNSASHSNLFMPPPLAHGMPDQHMGVQSLSHSGSHPSLHPMSHINQHLSSSHQFPPPPPPPSTQPQQHSITTAASGPNSTEHELLLSHITYLQQQLASNRAERAFVEQQKLQYEMQTSNHSLNNLSTSNEVATDALHRAQQQQIAELKAKLSQSERMHLLLKEQLQRTQQEQQMEELPILPTHVPHTSAGVQEDHSAPPPPPASTLSSLAASSASTSISAMQQILEQTAAETKRLQELVDQQQNDINRINKFHYQQSHPHQHHHQHPQAPQSHSASMPPDLSMSHQYGSTPPPQLNSSYSHSNSHSRSQSQSQLQSATAVNHFDPNSSSNLSATGRFSSQDHQQMQPQYHNHHQQQQQQQQQRQQQQQQQQLQQLQRQYQHSQHQQPNASSQSYQPPSYPQSTPSQPHSQQQQSQIQPSSLSSSADPYSISSSSSTAFPSDDPISLSLPLDTFHDGDIGSTMASSIGPIGNLGPWNNTSAADQFFHHSITGSSTNNSSVSQSKFHHPLSSSPFLSSSSTVGAGGGIPSSVPSTPISPSRSFLNLDNLSPTNVSTSMDGAFNSEHI